MEKLMYEARPYAFIILGVIAVMAHTPYPKVTGISALTLLACSSAILYWRHTQRQALAEKPRYYRH